MIRVASQLMFCSPDQILRQTVVEQGDNQVLTRLFSLESQQVESARTLFCDGIISMGVVSIKQQIVSTEIAELVANYQYVDLSSPLLSLPFTPSNDPLILDFGTTESGEINSLLQLYYPQLKAYSIFEIIAACVYYPALLLGRQCQLDVGVATELHLWQGVDLVNKQLTEQAAIQGITNI